MTKVRIPNYVVINGRGFWQAKPAMRALGMKSEPCGADGPPAWAKAAHLNAVWRARRTGAAEPTDETPLWPPRSVGDAWARYRRTTTWARKEPRTREEWERRWLLIGPVFGSVDPNTIVFDSMDRWYWRLVETRSVHAAFHTLKIWRALWKVMAALHYCAAGADPSVGILRETPRPRSQSWREGEVVRLVKHAMRRGYHGLACIIAVAWDTQFSPVDARSLTAANLTDTRGRLMFVDVGRQKTGSPAIGTLSRRTDQLVRAYLGEIERLPGALLFRTRAGARYDKDLLAKDFRTIRNELFGGDTRRLMDMRRSGAIEASAGGVNIDHLAAKMASTINQTAALQRTYIPVDATAVRAVDTARQLGRRRMRETE